jgi:hypothetical protein
MQRLVEKFRFRDPARASENIARLMQAISRKWGIRLLAASADPRCGVTRGRLQPRGTGVRQLLPRWRGFLWSQFSRTADSRPKSPASTASVWRSNWTGRFLIPKLAILLRSRWRSSAAEILRILLRVWGFCIARNH